MIPQDKNTAITRGLSEAFGVSECEDIREVTGGPGANPVFRIVVRRSAFLLRINLRAGDLVRHYACMKAAAEAGVAPRVWYTNVEDRISITDFVNAAHFGPADALARLPAALRALHSLPQFPGVPDDRNSTCMFLLHRGPAADAFLQQFQAANILPKEDFEELVARYTQIAAAYSRHDPELVSSHNDLFKPDNIVFDGQRVWLVDWEAAFRNDRYADLAVVANMLVTNVAEETAYLQVYFGQPPDAYQRARLHLMRLAAHLFYAVVFLWQGASSKPIDWSDPVPDYADFQRRFWAGEIKLTDAHTKTVYGRIHWTQFLHDVQQARYKEALAIVADRHAAG